MAQRYTNQQKADILNQLSANLGNVALTARQTGVPLRTLYTWKREQQPDDPALQHQKSPLLQHYTAETADHPEGEYARIRARLMDHINHLLDTLTDDPDTAHLRIMALSRLLDRVVKLEALTRADSANSVLRIEYVQPDGSISANPPWYSPDDDDTPHIPTNFAFDYE